MHAPADTNTRAYLEAAKAWEVDEIMRARNSERRAWCIGDIRVDAHALTHFFRLAHETQILYKKTGFFASPPWADLRCGNEASIRRLAKPPHGRIL